MSSLKDLELAQQLVDQTKRNLKSAKRILMVGYVLFGLSILLFIANVIRIFIKVGLFS